VETRRQGQNGADGFLWPVWKPNEDVDSCQSRHVMDGAWHAVSYKCSLSGLWCNRPIWNSFPFLLKCSMYLLKTVLVLALFSSCVHACQICERRGRERELSLAQTTPDLCDKNLSLPMFAKGWHKLESHCAIYKHI
jgi:hypothetical protein